MRYVSLIILTLIVLCIPSKTEPFFFRDSTDTPILQSAAADQMEAGTVQNRVVVPLLQQRHPSSAKAWVVFQGTATVTIKASYNVSSVTDNGVGNYTVNFSTPFSSANYCVQCTGHSDSGLYFSVCGINDSAGMLAGSVNIVTVKSDNATAVDSESVHVIVYGDQ